MKYKEDIVQMLFKAYFDARKHKRNKQSQLDFELHLEQNIFDLYDDVVNKTYTPGTSICFVVNKPVKREIFAANFRDRVMHHFIFSILNPLVEKVLLKDVYSCRKGKGTLFGINSAYSKMQSCSNNFKDKMHILKLDIAGYFMNINKNLLYQKISKIIDKNELFLPIQSNLLKYLISENIFHNPTKNCVFQSHKNEWINLPKNKSLFSANQNTGLPIGNLTSQLYGNLYLNEFDHFIKRLGIKHYGRYVDDFYLMHTNKKVLLNSIEKIKQRLSFQEKLKLHPKKIHLQNCTKGFSFLGIYILPYRKYVGKRIKEGLYNTLAKINNASFSSLDLELEKLQSYTSILKHHNCYNLRKKIDLLLMFSLSKYNYSQLKIQSL
jgi:RNA-directed DNA polymerase